MPPAKILVVDDDPAIRNLILRFLGQKDYQVESADNGKMALDIFSRFNPDLVILDINLPDTLGYNLCEEMQQRTGVFVLMLTGRTGAEDIERGFKKGADDYLKKPFDLQELEFRANAILKRRRTVTQTPQKQALIFDYLEIDPDRREITVNGNIVPFTALEFDLLFFLASHPGQALSRPQLISEVWDYSEIVGDQRVVDVHIGQIRKKIEVDASQPSLIKTIRGFGYRFEPPNPNDEA
ncbi:response regulator transcription factor [Lusitaniella coriacea LEGE 07157]|uniref:Response regulator transcription factor n=1 Tax=Lusitaniella coriacea LEGE 07157 TaxID=945747 RepID=A0A8J7ITT5_9CYAN|nr:response regulator transcription factor [Lusitaniella coriacea]MBE9117062.1 response regulator transcription factor [Lusitaniella coriacea LEGE 07157]